MKHKTRKKIAAFIVTVMLLAAAALVIVDLSSHARADEKPWKAIIADPSFQRSNVEFAKGEVAGYSYSNAGVVFIELTDGREYATNWSNVLMYKD